MKRLYIILILLLAGAGFLVESAGASAPVRSGHLFQSPEIVASDYTEICRDSDGYLWIGTERGLLRFDGTDYDIYRHDERDKGSLSDNQILDLLYDSKNRLWVATADGLNLYDRASDTFRLVKIPTKKFNGYIIAVDEQPDGTVTFVMSGVGLYVINEGKDGDLAAVRYMWELSQEKYYNSLRCASDGKMYAGDHLGYVHVVFPNGSSKSIKVGHAYVRGLRLEEDGNLIVSILDDLYRIETKTLNVDRLEVQDGEKLSIRRLSDSDTDGDIYFGTKGRGVWKIKAGDKTVRPYKEFYSPFMNIRKSEIATVYGNKDGGLWLGCNYKGIMMIPKDPIPFIYRKMSEYYPDFHGGVSSIARNGRHVFAAVDNEGICVMSETGDHIKTIRLPEGRIATSIEPAGEDRLLVGIVNSGVWELSVTKGSWSRLIDIPGSYLHIYLDTDGKDDLFVGMHGVGVMRCNLSDGSKKWLSVYNGDNSLPNTYVNKMMRHDGKLWIGLYGGIACYDLDGDSLVTINQDPFLSGSTFSFAPQDDGAILAATSHGLILYHPKKGVITKYTTINGLADNDVRSVTIDRNGGTWIGTMRGLSYLDPDTKTVLSYHGNYGLVENVFRHSALSKSDGKMYFSNDQGVTCFDPDDVKSTSFDKDVKISALYINGERIAPATRTGSRVVIEGDPMSPSVINLPYSEHALAMRLSTMDFRDAANIVYQWRMADMSEEWIETRPGENVIYIPYLDPGTHKLQIRAQENGVISPMMEIKINIAPPWYLSTWAKLVYLLVVATILVLGWIVMQKKKEEKINDAKIKFFIDVSHDIRSPITLILSPIEALLRQPFDEEVRRQLKTMQRNGQRILSLVNQLLDIRKLDKGKMRLSCRKTDVNRFVRELVDMFIPQAAECGLTLEFEKNTDPGEVWIDRDNLDKVLVNLISNAIKYTPKGGTIKVVTESVDDDRLGRCIRISVIDTGVGLDSKMEARIFERFYRVREDHAPATPGFGIGLDLCRRLAELHHGSITGRNRRDNVKGSVFSICIPLDESYYSPEELHVSAQHQEEEESGKHLVMSALPVGAGNEKSVRRKSVISKSILVVDDHEELRNYLCYQLASSYKVTGAKDGEEALKIIMDNPPDIIVSDVMMPGIDGLELLRRVKSNSSTSHIPVVLLSSRHELADRMAGWDKGADGYLGKPFNLEELEVVIDNLINNRLRMKGKFSGVQDVEGKIASPEVKGNDEKLMERIMGIIERYIDDSEFNVEKLSSEAGISRAHLHRKMKDQIGMTPSDFIRNIRLKRACELLQKPDIEVTQIAYLVGYTSQPHFSTAFKKFTGYTPSEYRQRLQSGQGAGASEK